jgi:hypothetical protein
MHPPHLQKVSLVDNHSLISQDQSTSFKSPVMGTRIRICCWCISTTCFLRRSWVLPHIALVVLPLLYTPLLAPLEAKYKSFRGPPAADTSYSFFSLIFCCTSGEQIFPRSSDTFFCLYSRFVGTVSWCWATTYDALPVAHLLTAHLTDDPSSLCLSSAKYLVPRNKINMASTRDSHSFAVSFFHICTVH